MEATSMIFQPQAFWICYMLTDLQSFQQLWNPYYLYGKKWNIFSEAKQYDRFLPVAIKFENFP